MSEYYKGFLSNAVEKLANIRRGHLSPPVYERMPLPPWDVGDDECLLFLNAKIIDVDLGKLKPETGVLLKGERIELLFGGGNIDSIREKYPVAKEIDCADRYLMPGMSDIHCHISSTTEMIGGIKDLAYMPAQREKNAEVSIRHGTTFLRDVGAARPPKEYLINEINAGRLVGPDVMTSYTAVIPRGGMWDFGKLKNKIAGAVIFGGDFAYFINSVDELKRKLQENLEGGSELIKTYQEEKPLYGFKEDTIFRMWKPEELKVIRDFADKHNQMVACHSMFIKGARIAIDTPVDTLEHMTVDSEYTLDDARKMAEKGVAIVPTLGVGLFLAIEMRDRGYADDPDLAYFKEYRKKVVRDFIEDSTVPELTDCYLKLLRYIDDGFKDDKMPGAGPIWPYRVTGFAHFVRKSFENFREAGVKVGIGTDGGLGTSFTGLLEPELHLSRYLGYSNAEVLRMATLGNMEICGLEADRGSIDPGKLGDIIILGSNPLEDVDNVDSIEMVFKRGRLYYSKSGE